MRSDSAAVGRARAGVEPVEVGRAPAATGQGERERRAAALLRVDPDPAAVLLDDVAGDGQPEARRRPPRRATAPGRPCRTARRRAPGRPAGCRPRGPRRLTTSSRRRAATRTVTSPPSGLNLTALWTQVDEDLAEPRPVAADRRQVAGRPRCEGHALAFGEQPQPLGRLGRERDPCRAVVEHASVPAALDPGQVEQLVDHLDEVAGLDLDLARSGRASGPGPRRPRPSASREQGLGEQADGRQRRPQLVRQVVDELGPDALEPAQLGDVLDDQPDAAVDGDRRARTSERRPVGAGERGSSPADAVRAGGPGDASTCGSRKASMQRAARPASPAAGPGSVGGRVRAGMRSDRIQAQDARCPAGRCRTPRSGGDRGPRRRRAASTLLGASTGGAARPSSALARRRSRRATDREPTGADGEQRPGRTTVRGSTSHSRVAASVEHRHSRTGSSALAGGRAAPGRRRGTRSSSHGAARRSNAAVGMTWRRTSRWAMRDAARRAPGGAGRPVGRRHGRAASAPASSEETRRASSSSGERRRATAVRRAARVPPSRRGPRPRSARGRRAGPSSSMTAAVAGP